MKLLDTVYLFKDPRNGRLWLFAQNDPYNNNFKLICVIKSYDDGSVHYESR